MVVRRILAESKPTVLDASQISPKVKTVAYITAGIVLGIAYAIEVLSR
jgi:hypothetical protein